MKSFFNRYDEEIDDTLEKEEEELEIINLDETAGWSKLEVADELVKQQAAQLMEEIGDELAIIDVVEEDVEIQELKPHKVKNESTYKTSVNKEFAQELQELSEEELELEELSEDEIEFEKIQEEQLEDEDIEIETLQDDDIEIETLQDEDIEYLSADDEDDEDEWDDEDEDLSDLFDEENPLYEITCPKCGEIVCMDEDMLFSPDCACPNCGTTFEIEFDEEECDCEECAEEDEE